MSETPARIKPLALVAALVTGVLAAGHCVDAPTSRSMQAGYSTAPLGRPVFDVARVAVESAALNDWLDANHAELMPEQMRGPREHLFYLIDSHAKHLYASTGAVKPAEPDLILRSLYSWAERLGVFGGSLVHDSLQPPGAEPGSPLLAVPESLSLELDADAFKLTSALGDWSVAFPYYFMIWNLGDLEARNGMRTQLAGISTGAGLHENVKGYSQATLMLMFSPEADHASFSSHWSQQIGVGDPLPPGTTDLAGHETRVLFDPETHVNTELVLWQTPKGSFALMYSGVDGTYQWNRSHFLDFFRSLRSTKAR
jgi:hypothetical protein